MNDTSSSNETPFWRFSLHFYRQPGVSDACIALQDGCGVDVNLLLFLLWLADEGQLLELVRKAIAANPKAVADFKKGKVKAADAIKGFVMRETKGMAKTETVQQLVMQELANA